MEILTHSGCEPQMLPEFENEGDFSFFGGTAMTELCLAYANFVKMI